MAKAVLQKNWYELEAPDIFDNQSVGETPAEKESQVIGRKVKESLTDLMDGTDKYYVDVELRIKDVEGNKAFTEIAGMEVESEFVSRIVKKRSDRFDYVEDFTTQDGRTIRIKIVGSTLRKTSSKKLNSARNKIKEILEEKTDNQSYEEIMENIFRNNIQEELKDEVDTIYPFKELEIRKTELRN